MNIIKFEEINSTNTYAKENLNTLNNFDVIFSDKQTAGYGQWGRKWIDVGDKNIYMSIILKPKKLSDVYTNIVRYTAICLCYTFKEYDVTPKIKEPNDIIINDKKISGILAESITKGEDLKGIVIGIGVNLNTDINILSQIDKPATSLNIETGKYIDKTEFAELFLKIFEENYSNFISKEYNVNLFL